MLSKSAARRATGAARLYVAILALGGGATSVGAVPPSLREMVEMRTIDSLSISPDGHYVGYRLLTPSIDENRVIAHWYRVPVDGGVPEAMGSASSPLFLPFFDMIEEGQSQWASDSRSLYALAEANSEVQVHRLKPGGIDDLVTRDGADVTSFAMDADQSGLAYQTRNSRAEIAALQAEEASHGLVLRTELLTEGTPLFRNFAIGNRLTTIRRGDQDQAFEDGAGKLRAKHLSFATGAVQDMGAATPPPPSSPSLLPAMAGRDVQAVISGRATLRLRPVSTTSYNLSTNRVTIERSGREQPCPTSFCIGTKSTLKQIDWRSDKEELVVRSASPETFQTSVYAWNPSSGRTRTVFRSDGLLNGGAQFTDSPCATRVNIMVCTLARSSEPQKLVRLNLDSGALTILADPNADLAHRDMGVTRRVTWADPDGRRNNGVLVLPRSSSSNLPMVVTLSSCPGFLEGGSVPLAPEHVLAARGIASLCVNFNPEGIPEKDSAGKPIPLSLDKALLVSLQSIVGQLAAEKIIDPKRVGIAGHSFGAMFVAYALSQSDLFAAGVIGTGVTTDPTSFYLTAPEPESARRSHYDSLGLPRPDLDPDHVWDALSPAVNARRIRAPLLLLPPENEYQFGLQLYASIRDAGGIARMIVYPGDGHLVSRHPRHLFERQVNSVDWFECWLNHPLPSSAPEKMKISIDASFRCPGQHSSASER